MPFAEVVKKGVIRSSHSVQGPGPRKERLQQCPDVFEVQRLPGAKARPGLAAGAAHGLAQRAGRSPRGSWHPSHRRASALWHRVSHEIRTHFLVLEWSQMNHCGLIEVI